MPDQLETMRPATDRPFPWRCPKCLEKTVHPVVMPYRAKAAHDGRLYELDIPDLPIPKCCHCGELVFSNRVDEQISRALRSHLRLLAPEQIQEARSRLGLRAAPKRTGRTPGDHGGGPCPLGRGNLDPASRHGQSSARLFCSAGSAIRPDRGWTRPRPGFGIGSIRTVNTRRVFPLHKCLDARALCYKWWRRCCRC